MQQQQLQKNDLQTLNELLLKERIAIINLRMERLSRIQQDMYPLLQRIAENAHDPDTEETNIIRQIQADIKHNRFLLKLGCKHFAIRQSVVLSLSAMTYGSNAMASVANSGPKMLSGECITMASLITSLYTGASGIYTNQTAVQVTGNNIANASTEGYSRQDVSITSASSLELGNLVFGTGSTVDAVERVENQFITEQLISQSADYGEYSAKSTSLTDIEQILSIDDSSLSSDIDAFFESWDELSSNPDGTTERQQVIQEAENLATQCNQISQQLADISESINSDLESLIPEVNDYLEQIASLNESINKAELSGGDANTLRDQRDLLVQEVSESIGATIYTDGNGMTCMQLENGLPLVIGDQASTLSTERTGATVELSLTSSSTTYSLTGDDFGGAAKGLLEVRDEVIPELEDEIDYLVYELANAVNTLHQTGTDQDGNSGADIFTLTAPSDPSASLWQGAAGSISVAFEDPSYIAAGTSGLAGDNTLALEMASLDSTTTVNNASFTEEYARIAAKAGLLVSSNEQQVDDSYSFLLDTTAKQDSLSGVSLDEEMLLLTQYQTGYEAASHYLSVIQEMLDTLMTL